MQSPHSALERLGLRTESLVDLAGMAAGLAETEAGPRLAILAAGERTSLAGAFEGEWSVAGERTLLVGPLSARNLAALREHLPWLRPKLLGLRTSAGLGDRLGLATPGHIRAMRAAGGAIAPVYAQQSIREMTRTGRSPEQVMGDASWGIFAMGWRDGFGADADHLKTPGDIDACVAAGYTWFTLDPGEYVDPAAGSATAAALRAAFECLPWSELEDAPGGLYDRYLRQPLDLEGGRIVVEEESLIRAAVKYGRAVAHVTTLARHLHMVTGGSGYEIEVSVDETETPTAPAEHVFIAGELRRLGVPWISLAPRYVGRFEKGVDYIGDLAALETDIGVHAAIARALGPYKLSLHSGSDKFSIYGVAARQTRGLVHLNTAGTSYLEALRTIAALDPALFSEIYAFARERYDEDRASYHVSARLEAAPLPHEIAAADLPVLLDQFDAREILHVTFGSVLTARDPAGEPRFAGRLLRRLRAAPEAYAANLEAHFRRHLQPFATAIAGQETAPWPA